MRSARARHLSVAIAVALSMLALLAGIWTTVPHPTLGDVSAGRISHDQLQSAIASLHGAQGPANGVAMGCTAASATTASCEATSPATSGAEWSNISSRVVPLPGPRWAVMTWDASDGYVLLYGGVSFNATAHPYMVKDTWSYLNGVWTNLTTMVAGGPPPTAVAPAMAYDPWTSEVIVFGGTTLTSSNLSLTWTYHARVWTNITGSVGTPPSPRWTPVFVADLASRQMILYGGDPPSSVPWFHDTWLFTGTAWSNISGTVGTSPPSLVGLSGAYDPAESGIVILGVNTAGPPYVANTFLFAGGAWHNLTSTEFGTLPVLDLPRMGYVATTSSLLAVSSLVFTAGAGSEIAYPVEWEFSDGNWTNITATGAFPQSGSVAGIATDPSGALLMFGGAYGPQDLGTQWMYAYSAGPSSTSLTATASTVDANLSINISATFSGGLAPFQTNLSFGDGSYATGVEAATHAYATPGTYHVEFNVTDFVGRSSVGTTLITVNADPSALVIHAVPSTPSSGSGVNFTATFLGGTPTFAYAWNFSDGATATSATAAHIFARAGTYTVRLTVTDADGRSANGSLALTVSSVGTTSSPVGGGTALYLIAGLIVVVILIALAVVLVRRRRPPTTTPSAPAMAWTPPPPGVMGSEPPAAPAPPSPPSGPSPPP